MGKTTDVRLCDVAMSIDHLTFRTPLKFGGRIVEHYQVVNVRMEVESRDGKRGIGLGSMPIGHIWAWPTTVEADLTERAMRTLTERLTKEAVSRSDFAHPLEHGAALLDRLEENASQVAEDLGLPEAMPRLAALVAASPVDAAFYDAYGHAHERNIYDLLGSDFVSNDLSSMLSSDFRREYLDRYTLRQPMPTMPLYHLVGALDPVLPSDVREPIGDGLPEHLAEWIAHDGLTHLKIKLSGDNIEWDVARVLDVERVARDAQRARGCSVWHYSLDFNEKCSSVDYVLEFLGRLEKETPNAFSRVQYIEQPTHRDLKNRGTSMAAAAKIKPVVIDESLVDFESLLLARELGYTGVALKACKGQTESLLMSAAALKFGMFLCVQDLTCPGASFLHSAGIAARIPGIAAIEGNGRQYCPAGNEAWKDRFPGMFEIREGRVATGSLTLPGLGHTSRLSSI